MHKIYKPLFLLPSPYGRDLSAMPSRRIAPRNTGSWVGAGGEGFERVPKLLLQSH